MNKKLLSFSSLHLYSYCHWPNRKGRRGGANLLYSRSNYILFFIKKIMIETQEHILLPLTRNFNSLLVSTPHAHKLQSYLVIWKWCRLFHMWLFLFIFHFTYMANCRFSKTSEQRLLYKQIKLHLNNISLSEQSLLFVKEQNIYTPSKSILHSSEIHFNVILCASFRYEQ